MAHLALLVQAAQAVHHEEHGIDVAQHPGQALLAQLQHQTLDVRNK